MESKKGLEVGQSPTEHSISWEKEKDVGRIVGKTL